MKKHVETNTGLIIIFAAAVIIFGGAYTWANLNPPVEVDYISSSPILTHASNNKTTYVNKEFGFSLGYSRDWSDGLVETTKSDPNDLLEKNRVFKLEITDLKNKLDIDCVNNEFQSWREAIPSINQCDSLLSALSLSEKEKYLGPRHPRNIYLEVHKNTDNLDLATWLVKTYRKENTELANYKVGEPIVLAGLEGYISSVGCCGNYDKSYVVSKNEYIFMLGTNNFEKLTSGNIPEHLLEVIKTFKFLNVAQSSEQ